MKNTLKNKTEYGQVPDIPDKEEYSKEDSNSRCDKKRLIIQKKLEENDQENHNLLNLYL